jgi:hypothetical protein
MVLFWRLPGAKWWTALTVGLCALLLVSNAIYFDGGPQPRFLLEKGAWAENPWWLAAFYFHVVGASVCLAVGTPLMFLSWTRRHPRWHRCLGYVYFNSVLWIAAPMGLALALTAKGGLWGTLGFAVAGAAWWKTTWSGYQAIRRGDVAAHVREMIRSYSWALSAPAFRVVQVSLFWCGLDDATNYIVSLWLSIAASVWLAESCLYRGRRSAAGQLAVRPPIPGVVP